MSARPLQPLILRRWMLILYWIAMYTATHWPEIDRYRPETGWPIPNFGTVMHICVYMGWVAMWWRLLSANGHPVRRSQMIWLIIGGIAYSIFDELTQALVAREPDIGDLIANIAGITFAITILRIWQWRLATTRSKRRQ